MASIKRTVVKRQCPACKGIRRVVHPFARKQDPNCEVCFDGEKSRGYVLNVVCGGCGRSAYERKEGIWYCGRENCWKRVKPVEIFIDGINRRTGRPDLVRFGGFNPWQRFQGETEEERLERIERLCGNEGGWC